MRISALLLAAALVLSCSPSPPSQSDVLVFAAASLRDALTDLAVPCERETGLHPVYNFAGSNVLALQIEAAPRADVFLSADARWMDHLEEHGAVVAGTRREILANRLVIVVPRDSPIRELAPGDLATLPYRFLSLGDPQAVPAGRYAKAWLEGIGVGGGTLWSRVAGRVAPAPDVRAALGLVEADPDVVGIVYATDAETTARVRVVWTVPEDEGPPIRYVAAVTRDAGPGRRFLDFLASDAARDAFRARGFLPLTDSQP